ncbi:grasp-with-spasm system ATP-grasp peptide maturase [Chryseobacterium daecheongense]|nr:grasp-with-spasm system ATP-grasp peptide maturase [Chryseobacterium daecheongense]
MVLIFSNKNDFTTNLVQDWLYYYGKKSVRINDSAQGVKYDLNGVSIIGNNGEEIEINAVDSCWYRKGRILKSPAIHDPISINEYQVIKEHIEFLLSAKNTIGNLRSDNMINKLIVLNIAKSVGLTIPNTYVLDNKKDLNDLLSSNPEKKFIIKMKTETCMFHFEDTAGIIYTNNLIKEDLKKFPSVFLPTLVQEKIDKYFEIRTFYLEGETWSMAIFSQNDEQTKDDYRKYNFNKPNRNTPFKIPAILEYKLSNLMAELNLQTGSIDWILSKDGQFYFLEINPTGQFSNLSMTCNYPLEKIIAEKL